VYEIGLDVVFAGRLSVGFCALEKTVLLRVHDHEVTGPVVQAPVKLTGPPVDGSDVAGTEAVQPDGAGSVQTMPYRVRPWFGGSALSVAITSYQHTRDVVEVTVTLFGLAVAAGAGQPCGLRMPSDHAGACVTGFAQLTVIVTCVPLGTM